MQPASIAVVGASPEPGSVGDRVMRNLLAGGFAGPVLPVNPRHRAIHGLKAWPDPASLPEAADLAVICTPPKTVPGLIHALGERGTRAAVVITAGLREPDDSGVTLQQRMLDAARPFGLRILGSNCLGLLLPHLGINASFAHIGSLPGRLAFVSQSGALCTAVLDWATSRGIGFSAFVSLGDAADVDFGDLLDHFATDPATRGVLLYMESVTHARKFLSAGRACARNKPVICLKAGRFEAGAKAAFSHTGAMAGSDDVMDAAIRRAGMLRVDAIEDLFAAVETLAHARPIGGERLAILTNGGGPGVLAADQLAAMGLQLPALGEATRTALDDCLPATWSRGNPVDIVGDADAARYLAALRVLLKDPGIDAVLVMLVPTATVDNRAVAEAVAAEAGKTRKTVLACWMGEGGVADARRVFANARVASYDTPGEAVRAFMQMVDFQKNQLSLMQVPPSIPEDFRPDREGAAAIVRTALAEGREVLADDEVTGLLQAWAIPVVRSLPAQDPGDAAARARELGVPVALKIRSPDITHKSEVGGVALGLDSPAEVEKAAKQMMKRVREKYPEARIAGFTVQEMVRRPGARELICGVSEDPVFGPVILFGQGGTAVEVVKDRAIALPPLNLVLARQLVDATRVSRLLKGYRNVPAVDFDALCLTLVKIAQMVVDVPELVELDINPLLADERGVLALDARMRIRPGRGPDRLAIRPYPRDLEETAVVDGVTLKVRPIRPEDGPLHREFFRRLSSEDVYLRFFRPVRELSQEQLARFTQIDYDREMSLVALREDARSGRETLGVVHAVTDPNNIEAEFAVIVRSDWHRHGIGRILMERIIRYCRERGTRRLVGQTLTENRAMLGLARRLGFECRAVPGEAVVELRLHLDALDRHQEGAHD